MNTFSFFKIAVVSFILLFVTTSCDKDFNEIGANIIGGQNFSFEKKEYTITSYSQKDTPVQSNNMAINQLGVFEDPFYGKTTASFVTQLELATPNPTFTGTIDVDVVELIVPYFSTPTTSTENNVTTTTYTLNSIYPVEKNLVSDKINLSVYRTGSFLNSFNPDYNYLPFRYFSNGINDFTIVSPLLNSATPSDNVAFQFNSGEQTETIIKTNVPDGKRGKFIDEVYGTNKIPPCIKLNLDKNYFKTMLFSPIASGKLVDNFVFKNYCRGLFFKVEGVSGQNALSLIDFKNGKIRVFYTETNAGVGVKKSIVLNLAGNTVNLYQNDYGTSISGLPTSTTPVSSPEKMFVKGGEGFHSYLDLFGGIENNGVVDKNSPELMALKQSNWIINEANIVVTVDNTFTGINPYRLYLYDAKNNNPLVDYILDQEVRSSNPKSNKSTFGGIAFKDPITAETKYKFRITEHVKNLVKRDSTNVRLGLVVTEDVNNVVKKFNTSAFSAPYNLKIPEASVINPLGTILWGSNPSGANNSKRVIFEIFYTKPN